MVKAALVASLMVNVWLFQWCRKIARYAYKTTEDLEMYRKTYGPDAWTVYNPETGLYT